MQCMVCNENCPDMQPGEAFCGNCGHDAAAHQGASASPVVAPTSPQPLASPVQRGTYQSQISRATPTCLIFLLDQSGSMEEAIGGGSGHRKKDAVCDAINNTLRELVLSCSRETGVWHYFDIGIWTYGGREEIQPLFGGLLSVADLEKRARIERRRRKMPDGAGGVIEQEIDFPVWVDPAARGETPMRAAFEAVRAPLQGWLDQHPNSFPPIIMNLSDGAFTGESPVPVVWDLMQKGTSDGNVLVFNCHISKDAGAQILFPGNGAASRLQGPQRDLFDISSPLPAIMTSQARRKGYDIEPGGRGYVYNAQHVTMIEFLDIGTRSAQERME